MCISHIPTKLLQEEEKAVTLRKRAASAVSQRSESVHDMLKQGIATSTSAALEWQKQGFGRRYYSVVAVIGDGALTRNVL